MKPNSLPLWRVASSRGFTLIEIMVVVVILGLLSTLVAVSVMDAAAKARRQKAASDCVQIAAAAKLFFIENGRAPSLEDLVNRDLGRRYIERVPKDPWGNEYVLHAEDNPPDFEVRSNGRNRMAGDDDDVSSRDVSE